MTDSFGRDINYMRVSITDRCNLRCRYCMPDGCDKVPMSAILTYEEIERICRAAADLGINRIKITGGEPFVRLGCIDLIRAIKQTDGIDEVTVTTNGQTLYQFIDELKDIGVGGINISLDTLDPLKFAYITGGGSLDMTLRSIALSAESGIRTKVNCLLQKGFNEDEIISLADLAFKYRIDVRFIEMMPVGAGKSGMGISNKYVLQKLSEHWADLEADGSIHGNGPAVYYRRQDAEGGIGLISAIHGKFCKSCNRIRLTSQGQVKPCLCYDTGVDIKPFLSGTDDELRAALHDAILMKPEAHCFDMTGDNDLSLNSAHTEKRLMSQIGG